MEESKDDGKHGKIDKCKLRDKLGRRDKKRDEKSRDKRGGHTKGDVDMEDLS